MGTFSTDMPWVIFHLLDEQFAVSANHVREMVAMPKVVRIASAPPWTIFAKVTAGCSMP